MQLGQGVNSNSSDHFPQGAAIVRLHDSGVRWGLISTARGSYSWTRLDSYLALAEAAKVKVVYTICSTPAFAAASTPADTGAYGVGTNALPNLTMLGEFVTALLKHCQRADGTSRLYAVEAWNEWNNKVFLDAAATPAQVVAIAQTVRNAVKAVNPGVLVTSPTPCWTTLTTYAALDRFLAAGGSAYADVITFHGYLSPGAAPGGIGSTIDNLRSTMAKYGVTKQLWDTESGWDLNANVPDTNKPAWLQAWIDIRAQKNLDAAMWYQWDNKDRGTLWTPTGGLNAAGQTWLNNVRPPLPAVSNLQIVG